MMWTILIPNTIMKSGIEFKIGKLFNPIDIRFNPIDIRFNPIDIKLNPIDIRLNLIDIRLNPIDIRLNLIDIRLNPTDIRFKLMSLLSIFIMMKGIFYSTLRISVKNLQPCQNPEFTDCILFNKKLIFNN